MPTPAPPVAQPKITTNDFSETHPRQGYYGPKPMVLLILDGWGIGPNDAGNAIARAQTPNVDNYSLSYPHTQLGASGKNVGLPDGEDGNTEAGHLNIGAGTIVYQSLPKIDAAIENNTFYTVRAFIDTCTHVKNNGSNLHLMGLVGAGEVHSSIEHLYALLQLCKQQEVNNVFIHAFTDGRDSPPTSGIDYLQELQEQCNKIGVGRIASIMGRYYAMDRDLRWQRIEKAYNTLTIGNPITAPDVITAIKEQYDQKITDEFIEPTNIAGPNGEKYLIRDNDAVIFFNFRIDRPRELTKAFVIENFEAGLIQTSDDPNVPVDEPTKTIPTFKRQIILKNLFFTTMTEYEKQLPVKVAFSPQILENPICKVFANYVLKQLRMSETEKEKFVTYHMNGQKNIQYPGEDRVIIPSKGVKSYDEAPEMSALEITQEMLDRIATEEYDVIIANIANPDMVSHTGNLEASIKACEITDQVTGQIVNAVYAKGGVVLITSDHGNAEELINKKGKKDTKHSIYPVPLLIIGRQFENNPTVLPQGILADVAPTMLSIMGIPKPDSMTGQALI